MNIHPFPIAAAYAERFRLAVRDQWSRVVHERRRRSIREPILALLLIVLCPESVLAGPTVASVAVDTVEALYDAVNDPDNAGVTVVLAPGSYLLSPTAIDGSPRPFGGRLDLQENMSLVGELNDRSAVVIDASALPASSYTAGGIAPSNASRSRCSLVHGATPS